MKKVSTICTFFFTFSLVLSGCNTNSNNLQQNNTAIPSISQEVRLTIKDYFPIQTNKSYIYKGEGNEYAGYTTYIDYTLDDSIQIRKINSGTTSVSVYKIQSTSLEEVFSKGESYSRENFIGKEDNIRILLKTPLEIGNSWNEDVSTKRTITNINVPLKLPLGDFSALEVTCKNDNSVIKEYYVKNIGLVKSIFKDNPNTNEVSSELEKIQANTPFSQKVKIYYPDFPNEKIFAENKTLDFFTNEDPTYKFQTELKLAPTPNKDISPTLTKGAKILSIVTNPTKNLVTVDLSKEFVSEMNAGASFEYLILNSLANTFGEYYQEKKFNLTVEGKQYSSGHMVIDEIDYFDVTKDLIVPKDEVKKD